MLLVAATVWICYIDILEMFGIFTKRSCILTVSFDLCYLPSGTLFNRPNLLVYIQYKIWLLALIISDKFYLV
jgi:hypothetical protein